MTSESWLLGNKPLEKRLNVRRELRRLSKDPLHSFIVELDRTTDPVIFHDERARYLETYWCYYLCLERFLPEQALVAQWMGHFKAARGRRYTSRERVIADRYNAVHRVVHVDLYNCVLWSRIVMDRVVSLARYFLRPRQVPSFTSFNQHKKFLMKHVGMLGDDEAYAEHIREQTPWFDAVIKLVRDHFVVHASPQHMRFFGVPYPSHEFGMIVLLPREPGSAKPLASVNTIMLTVPRLARDIEEFLKWFNAYAIAAVRRNRGRT